MTDIPSPQPAPALPQFIRAEVELAIAKAVAPTGMSVHDGRALIGHDKLRYMLALIDSQAAKLAAIPAPEGAQGDEREECVSWLSGLYPDAWPRQDAEHAWDHGHVFSLAWKERGRRAALAAPAPQAPAWQPIETLPDDTLAILYGAKRSEMVIGMRHSRDGWVIDTPSEWASMYPPKLWMPLPAAPQTKEPTNDR